MNKYTGFDELDDRPATKVKIRNRPRRASLLGLLAVLVGLSAVAVSQRDKLVQHGAPYTGYLYSVGTYEVQPYHVAAAGAGLAVLALLVRSMTGRTRGGWPVLALLLCGGAAGTYRYETSTKNPGTPERWVKDRVVDPASQWVNDRLHPAAQPVPADVTTAAPATQPADLGDASPAPKPAAPATQPNIFGV